MGVRAGGRGGADTAVADDATAVVSNPAGLAFIDGQRFDQFFAGFSPNLRWKNPVDSAKSEPPSPGLIFGAAFGVAFDWEEPWKLGEALTFSEETYSETPSRSTPDYEGSGVKLAFGVFPLSGSVVDISARSPFFPDREMPWEADIKEVALTFGVAWRPLHWLSIGIAPEFVYAQLENDQPVTQPRTILQGHPTGRTGPTYSDVGPFLGVTDIEGYADIDDARTFGGRVVLGVLAVPWEWETGQLQLGLAYTSQAWKQDFLGEGYIDFNEQLRQVDPDGVLLKPVIESETGIPADRQNYAGKTNVRLSPLNLPHMVSGGVALRQWLGDVGLLVSADVRWINWSATWDKIELRLTDGESAELNELIGDDSSTAHAVFPLEWRDQVVLAGGLAVSPLEWFTLRAGYNYGRNPIPRKTVQPTTPAILEHHVMVGAGFHVRRWELSLLYEHAFENSVKIGRSISNRDVENSEITVSLDAFAFGISVRF
jgi:long-subunit fatty acid transport protein